MTPTKMKVFQSACPVLYDKYRDAMQVVYDAYIRTSAKHYARFAKREDELVDANIMLGDYAMFIARKWQSWVRGQGLRCLPPTVFCGPKSMDMLKNNCMALGGRRRRKQHACNQSLVLADEYWLGCTVVSAGGAMTAEGVLAEMALSKDWHIANDGGKRPTKQIADMLCAKYHVAATLDYQQIGEIARDRV